MEIQMGEFIERLSSKEPVPGGGGASALIGATGVALCSMVANLTSGKKKYAQYQSDIEQIISRTQISINRLLALIQKDAEVFEPLSVAYGIPKDEPGRDEIMEKALVTACSVPMEILMEISDIIDVIEQLAVKGTRLAVSDVGVAASAMRCALESAVLNVYINTKLMKNRETALELNAKAEGIISDATEICNRIYCQVAGELRG